MKNDNQVYVKNQGKWIPSIGIVLVVCILLLTLAGCAATVEGKQDQENSDTAVIESVDPETTAPVNTAEPSDQDVVTVAAEDLVGPWHLEPEVNDEAAVNETFPGAMEFGSSMEITSDGKISWYIGADGGSGTYTLDGAVLSASMTNDFDGTDMTVELTAEKDGDQILLTMDYKGLTLRWAWGERETGKGEE